MSAEVARLRFGMAKEFTAYADHGAGALCDTMWDQECGGFHWQLDAHDHLSPSVSSDKHAYGQAFAIFALSNVFAATGNASALETARRGFEWLESNAHDARHGGYFEAFTRQGVPILSAERSWNPTSAADWLGTPYGYKSMNTNIHLLEALTELYKVWPVADLRNRLVEMLSIVRDRFVGPPGTLYEFCTPDWRPVSGVDSYGHDIETSYLLVEAAETLGILDEKTKAASRLLADHTLRVAVDQVHGGIFDAGTAFNVWHKDKIWWSQAEALNAFLLMHKLFGDTTDDYFNAFIKQWDYIRNFQIDRSNGGWWETVRPDGSAVTSQSKAHNWKANYHTGRALMHVADALRRMAGSERSGSSVIASHVN